MGKAQRGILVNSALARNRESAVNRDASNVVGAQTIDDGFIQRLAIPLVVFADVDRIILALPSLFRQQFRRRIFCFFSAGLTIVVSCISISPAPTMACNLGSNSSTFCAVSMNSILTGRWTAGRRDWCLHVMIRAKSSNAARHGCARHAMEKEKIRRLHTWHSVVLLVLSYVNADLLTHPGVSTFPPVIRVLFDLSSRFHGIALPAITPPRLQQTQRLRSVPHKEGPRRSAILDRAQCLKFEAGEVV